MKDIIFINPPGKMAYSYFPLGIGYLNEILKMEEIDTEILDIYNMISVGKLKMDSKILENIEKIVCEKNARIYALHINSSSAIWAAKIIEIIKKRHCEAKVIIGGPQATLLQSKALIDNPNIDYVVVFEGEKIIFPLIKTILNGNCAELANVKNVYYKDINGNIKFNGLEKINQDMDNLPIVDFDINEYSKVNNLIVDIGRGCPLDCYFCSTNYIWMKKSRFKSAERIVEESEFYYNKIKYRKNPLIHFTHDNYLIEKNLLKDVIYYKKRKAAEFEYACTTRIDFINNEIIKQLKESGCKQVFFGIESGSSRIQKICKKNLNLSDVLPKIKMLTDSGIFVETNYIIGFPEETLEDLFSTFRLMANVRWVNPSRSAVDFSLMVPSLHSYLGENTSVDDYIFNEMHDTYRDLLNAGIDSRLYSRSCNPNYYTIRNANYDVLNARNFAIFFLGLLTYFPVSMYTLFYKYSYEIESLYNLFTNSNLQNEDLKNINLYYSWLCNLLSEDTESLYKDVLEFEKIRALSINNLISKGNTYRFNYQIQNIYKELKVEPQVLFNNRYVKNETVIKI